MTTTPEQLDQPPVEPIERPVVSSDLVQQLYDRITAEPSPSAVTPEARAEAARRGFVNAGEEDIYEGADDLFGILGRPRKNSEAIPGSPDTSPEIIRNENGLLATELRNGPKLGPVDPSALKDLMSGFGDHDDCEHDMWDVSAEEEPDTAASEAAAQSLIGKALSDASTANASIDGNNLSGSRSLDLLGTYSNLEGAKSAALAAGNIGLMQAISSAQAYVSASLSKFQAAEKLSSLASSRGLDPSKVGEYYSRLINGNTFDSAVDGTDPRPMDRRTRTT